MPSRSLPLTPADYWIDTATMMCVDSAPLSVLIGAYTVTHERPKVCAAEFNAAVQAGIWLRDTLKPR